ncbi:hypothetical protein GGX14DRAFT_576753 [Mycena pura]|uniref:Uncharacterized protein n=1 Tax=Mycena pura TaxID=153505 RepID=A0AAD6UT55_9AGAR|nr:hypothetical protein GGX14DRAFT_576753 [Mycena pura]
MAVLPACLSTGKMQTKGERKKPSPPPEPMSLPGMCPLFFVDAGNWQGQQKHDAGFLQHYAFNAELIPTASSAARQDGWRWDFERVATWQEVLERGRAHCQGHHHHADGFVRPSQAIVYEDEPLAAAAAHALGLPVQESNLDNLYASDDEPAIHPAPSRGTSLRPRGTSLVSDPPSPKVAGVSSDPETPPRPPMSSASAAQVRPIVRVPASTPTLWLNEYIKVVYAEGTEAVESLVRSRRGGVRSVTRRQAIEALSGLPGLPAESYMNERTSTLYVDGSEAIDALLACGESVRATTHEEGIQRLSARRV